MLHTKKELVLLTKEKTFRPLFECCSASEQEFIIEYLTDLNASRAYKATHPNASPAVCRKNGCRLLKRSNVARVLKAEAALRLDENRVEVNEIIQQYKNIAFSDLRDVYEWDSKGNIKVKASKDLPEGLVITEVKKTKSGLHIKVADQQKALDSLSRYYGIAKEQVDVNVKGQINVVIDVDDEKI